MMLSESLFNMEDKRIKLVAKFAECKGSRKPMGYLESIEECSITCSSISKMFTFGRKSARCNREGHCMCVCQLSEKKGTWEMEFHWGYDLYSISKCVILSRVNLELQVLLGRDCLFNHKSMSCISVNEDHLNINIHFLTFIWKRGNP